MCKVVSCETLLFFSFHTVNFFQELRLGYEAKNNMCIKLVAHQKENRVAVTLLMILKNRECTLYTVMGCLKSIDCRILELQKYHKVSITKRE